VILSNLHEVLEKAGAFSKQKVFKKLLGNRLQSCIFESTHVKDKPNTTARKNQNS